MSDTLWNKIKSLPFPVYGLPHQTLEQHVNRLPMEGDTVFLIPKSGAVVPMLEMVLGGGFTIEQTDKYVMIKSTDPTPQKVEAAVKQQNEEKREEKVKKLTKH